MTCCKVCCGCKECDEGEEGKCCCGLECCAPDTYCCNAECVPACSEGQEGDCKCTDACCYQDEYCCDGYCVEACGEGGVGPCKCNSTCCAEGEFCCDGVCQAEPCECETDEDCPEGEVCCADTCCPDDGCCGCVDGVCVEKVRQLYVDVAAGNGDPLCFDENNEPTGQCDCGLPSATSRPCVDPEDIPETDNNGRTATGSPCPCGEAPVITGWPLDKYPIEPEDYTVECRPLNEDETLPDAVDPDFYPAICDPP